MVEAARSKTLCKLTLRVCFAGSERCSQERRRTGEDKGDEDGRRDGAGQLRRKMLNCK